LLLSACNDKPVANFTWLPENPKVNEEVPFTNLSSYAKRFSWNLGNMTINDELNPKKVYLQEGIYVIDLSAMNGLKSDIKTVLSAFHCM
jgi:PKD repeat protein